MKRLFIAACAALMFGVCGSVEAQTMLSFSAQIITPVNVGTGQVINDYPEFVASTNPPYDYVNLVSFGDLSQYQNMTFSPGTITGNLVYAATPGVYMTEVYGATLDISGNITYADYTGAVQTDEGAALITIAADGVGFSEAGVGINNLENGLQAKAITIGVLSAPLFTYVDNLSLNTVATAIPTPEPSTWALLATGAMVLWGVLIHRRHQA